MTRSVYRLWMLDFYLSGVIISNNNKEPLKNLFLCNQFTVQEISADLANRVERKHYDEKVLIVLIYINTQTLWQQG